jgi:hypothetical protein
MQNISLFLNFLSLAINVWIKICCKLYKKEVHFYKEVTSTTECANKYVNGKQKIQVYG